MMTELVRVERRNKAVLLALFSGWCPLGQPPAVGGVVPGPPKIKDKTQRADRSVSGFGDLPPPPSRELCEAAGMTASFCGIERRPQPSALCR